MAYPQKGTLMIDLDERLQRIESDVVEIKARIRP
jgi:hypothetical protein